MITMCEIDEDRMHKVFINKRQAFASADQNFRADVDPTISQVEKSTIDSA